MERYEKERGSMRDYKVESIEGDIYVVVFEEGSYRHEMRLEKHKIEKL